VSSAQEAFESLVRDRVWPSLREHGFKRSRSTFHRRHGPNWQVVNLQKSEYSSRDEVSFTVNLAIGLESLREGVLSWPDGRRPAESKCHVRQRMGALLTGEDVWWDVTADGDIEQTAEAVRVALEQYGLPWLDAHTDDERLAAIANDPVALRATPPFVLHPIARLMRKRGDEGAAEAVEQELARQTDPAS
jgi:hypothetical protein